jgi:hypothetical protein
MKSCEQPQPPIAEKNSSFKVRRDSDRQFLDLFGPIKDALTIVVLHIKLTLRRVSESSLKACEWSRLHLRSHAVRISG